MGMFDEVVVKSAMFYKWLSRDWTFQTKDFENELDLYTISEDGRLGKQKSTREGYGVYEESEPVDQNFDGAFELFGFHNHVRDQSVELLATFRDGVLIEVSEQS